MGCVIMVDEMRVSGKLSYCHMTVDDVDLQPLHDFAARLGLRREWFKEGTVPHYSLSRSQRQQALRLGAVYVPSREMFTIARDHKKARERK